jgi:histidyl-tRNA synthetase
MARPASLSGFPEYLPTGRMVEQHVLDTFRQTFELWGFAPIETRAAEPLEELLRKGEIDKEVYVLRRLQADEDEDDAGRRLGLHFDLTVPFARYVLENAGKLQFPFRRYQIQKVWRGERPQEGRYREFLQADVDVVGNGELPFHHDVEVAQVMAEALVALPLPQLRLQLNNRKLIEGFYRGVGAPDVAAVMRVIDKIDKVAPDAVRQQLISEAKLDEGQADLCLRLAVISAPDASFADRVRALGVTDPLLDEGLEELVRVVDGVAGLRGERFDVTADLRIARGLDYYTGTVYETRMAGQEHLGSVCSGGRYDSLASDGTTTYPGVGISFGVTRTLAPLIGRGALTATRSVPSAVVVAVSAEDARSTSNGVAAALRARGIPAEVAPSAAKYGKQIRHADRRGIPFVWFPQDDGTHQVRDIRSGEQVPADPQSWRPPEEDLHARVVSG